MSTQVSSKRKSINITANKKITATAPIYSIRYTIARNSALISNKRTKEQKNNPIKLKAA